MFKIKGLSVLIILLLLPFFGWNQSAKKYFGAAEKFEEAGSLKDAIDNYTKALDTDPNYEKAYTARARCYEKTDKKAEAIEDYKKLIIFSPKEKELYYQAGRLSYDIGKFSEADQFFRKALERDKGYIEV